LYYVCISRLDVAFWASRQEDIWEASGSGLVWAKKADISRNAISTCDRPRIFPRYRSIENIEG
jgi:hypothetical protein